MDIFAAGGGEAGLAAATSEDGLGCCADIVAGIVSFGNEVGRVHHQKLRFALCLISCDNSEILSLFLEHKRCILEHCRVGLAENHCPDAVDFLRLIEKHLFECGGLFFGHILDFLLEAIVLVDELLYRECKVRGVVEQGLRAAQGVLHHVHDVLRSESCPCLDSSDSRRDCAL